MLNIENVQYKVQRLTADVDIYFFMWSAQVGVLFRVIPRWRKLVNIEIVTIKKIDKIKP